MSILCDVLQHFVFDNLILMASIQGCIFPLGRVSPTRCSPGCIMWPWPHFKLCI